jgi:hypothetical protein
VSSVGGVSPVGGVVISTHHPPHEQVLVRLEGCVVGAVASRANLPLTSRFDGEEGVLAGVVGCRVGSRPSVVTISLEPRKRKKKS